MLETPDPVQTLLHLFSTVLADVRFADVDAASLARLADEVTAASAVVAESQAALDEARAALQARQEALLQRAQRALAYARVYAEADDALSARLEAIALPRPARRGAREDSALVLSAQPSSAPRRGRPRKAASEVASAEPELIAAEG